MKILIVVGGFFPGKKYGGPPVSVDNFCTLLGSDAECYIVTHNHDKDDNKIYEGITDGWNDRGNAKILYLGDREYNYKTFLRIAKELQPKYIYLQGLFQSCVVPCLRVAKILNIQVVLAPRGELCAGAFRKKYKKIPYICAIRLLGLLRSVHFQSTSDEETEAIKRYLGADESRIHFLTNIPSIPHDLPQHQQKEIGKGKFVFISRIVSKKNLRGAISYFKNVTGEATFDIYGPKEDENYWRECQEDIKELPSNIKVSYKGLLAHDEIHHIFCQYDAFLFPTLSENFGHVIAESLLTGCVPVISDQTPWTDMNEVGAGWALPLESKDDFRKAIQEIIDYDDNKMRSIRTKIEEYVSSKLKLETQRGKYLKLFV